MIGLGSSNSSGWKSGRRFRPNADPTAPIRGADRSLLVPSNVLVTRTCSPGGAGGTGLAAGGASRSSLSNRFRARSTYRKASTLSRPRRTGSRYQGTYRLTRANTARVAPPNTTFRTGGWVCHR